VKIFQFLQPRRHGPDQAPSAPANDVGEKPDGAEAGLDGGPRPSLNALSRDDMISACRHMAMKELGRAESAGTRGERADHVYNAASWAERADLLQRIERSGKKTSALNRAVSQVGQDGCFE
jgi:hypothetical protein